MTQLCRSCGCSNLSACEGGCWWVEDDLCSSCCTHPDWRLDYINGPFGPVIRPLEARQVLPTCTVCHQPVQVGAPS